jgi:dihydrofolate reductase
MNAIAAMALNRVIGKGNKIPWHLPEDFKWFKKTTMGHPILMGRKTFESIGKPLPGRRNLVVSRTAEIEGVEIVRDLERFEPAAFEEDGKEVFVMGGAEIYRQLLPRCQKIYLTLVKREYDGDAFFPEFESDFAPDEKILETPEFEVRLYQRARKG